MTRLQPEAGLIYSPIPFNGEIADQSRRGAFALSFGLGFAAVRD